MSDSDGYMDESDQEYDYEYGSENDEEDEPNEDDEVGIEIENSYYEADDLKNENPARAIELLEKVVRLEKEQKDADSGFEAKWTFKALHKMAVLLIQTGRLEEALARYKTMLGMMGTVAQNECTDAINSVLAAVGGASAEAAIGVGEIYGVTLEVLKQQGNSRLWFNTACKLARVHLAAGDGARLLPLLAQLFAECRTAEGEDDMTKATSLMELYCVEIQWYESQGDLRRMKELYPRTLELNAAVPNPLVLGTVREIGGKMYMREKDWGRAYSEFYAAFQKFQEAGSGSAKANLKYAVLANMLALSEINPFDSQEARALQDDTEILALTKMRRAFEDTDCKAFHKVMRDPKNRVLDDPFIAGYANDLLHRIRGQSVLRIVAPYDSVKIPFLALEIRTTNDEARSIVTELILDGDLRGQLDCVTDSVLLQGGANANGRRAEVVQRWVDKLDDVRRAIVDKA